MEWINVRVATLRAPEYIGSSPIERAAWLNVLAYCADQENGGRVKDALNWKDRQWQQTCGVTLREVMKATKLLTWDGSDLLVWDYPVEKQREVQAKREAGREGGRKSAEARSKQNPSTASTGAPSTASNCAATEGEGEGEGKGIGKEGEEEKRPPAFAEIPTPEEVQAEGTRSGIPSDYCSRFHAKADEQHAWLNKHGRLIEWRKVLLRFWLEDQHKWGKKPMNGMKTKEFLRDL